MEAGNARWLWLAVFVFASCANVALPAGWSEYRGPLSSALRGPTQGGALSSCVQRWVGPIAIAREKVLRAYARRVDSSRGLVVLLEEGNVYEPFYQYAMATEERAIRGIVDGGDVDETDLAASAPAAFTKLWGARESIRSDETLSETVRDGTCYFLTLSKDGEYVQAGVYAPPMNEADWSRSGDMPGLGNQLRVIWALDRFAEGPR